MSRGVTLPVVNSVDKKDMILTEGGSVALKLRGNTIICIEDKSLLNLSIILVQAIRYVLYVDNFMFM